MGSNPAAPTSNHTSQGGFRVNRASDGGLVFGECARGSSSGEGPGLTSRPRRVRSPHLVPRGARRVRRRRRGEPPSFARGARAPRVSSGCMELVDRRPSEGRAPRGRAGSTPAPGTGPADSGGPVRLVCGGAAEARRCRCARAPSTTPARACKTALPGASCSARFVRFVQVMEWQTTGPEAARPFAGVRVRVPPWTLRWFAFECGLVRRPGEWNLADSRP